MTRILANAMQPSAIFHGRFAGLHLFSEIPAARSTHGIMVLSLRPPPNSSLHNMHIRLAGTAGQFFDLCAAQENMTVPAPCVAKIPRQHFAGMAFRALMSGHAGCHL